MEAKKEDLIYELIFSEKLEFDIKISDYTPVNSCDKFIEELKDVLKKANSVKTSCILYNTTKNSITDKNISINFSFKNIEVFLILNVELKGKSSLKVDGSNYSLSNISFIDGDKNYSVPDHII